jgi:hypothetical protein
MLFSLYNAHTAVFKVPFGSLGVRTAYDLEEDAKKGRGGIFIRHASFVNQSSKNMGHSDM